MLNKTWLKKYCIIAFLLCEAVLGILVQTSKGKAVVVVSYASVVLACLFAALFFEKTWKYALTQAGLICTVLADWFLVVSSPMKQLPAMVFFSITQLCYFLRLYLSQSDKKQRQVHCLVRAVAVAVALSATVIVLKGKTDALSLVSLFYYANLLVNILFAFIQFKTSSSLAIGLALFAMCDTLIGLDVMADSYIEIDESSFIYKILHSGINLAWIFYVPSQSLIAVSLAKTKNKA